VFSVQLVVSQQETYPNNWLSFHSHDIADLAGVHTVLTSMYAHANLGHLMLNILGLALIGIVFEQRIGTKPFILLYLISGLVGTLGFAAYYWNDQTVGVLGASGAVSGILGGFARLYPNERMSIIFLPGVPMRAAYVVLVFVALQLFFLTGSNVAWQSHLAGLAAGIIFAPLVTKVRSEVKVKRSVSILALRKLAVTPELQGILRRIESEEVPDVRKAWIGHFLSKARCPRCGAPVKVAGDFVRCNRGHIL
jgi:membrane associated rhomboid family serine protease